LFDERQVTSEGRQKVLICKFLKKLSQYLKSCGVYMMDKAKYERKHVYFDWIKDS